jgi:hypothetical protein
MVAVVMVMAAVAVLLLVVLFPLIPLSRTPLRLLLWALFLTKGTSSHFFTCQLIG